MQIQDKICKAGLKNRPNEDVFGYSEKCNITWVIDGATGLTDEPLITSKYKTDAAWFANRASQIMFDLIENDKISSKLAPKNYIDELLLTTIKILKIEFGKIKRRNPKGKYEEPCASIAVIYSPKESDRIYAVTLGDCPILIESNDKLEAMLGSETLAKLDKISCQRAKPYLEKGIDFVEMRNAIKDTLFKHRNMMNSDEGYWIFSLNTACTKHVIHKSFAKQKTKHILIMSDGFYALVDKYSKYNDKELIKQAKTFGLLKLYKELRQIEEKEDPKCQKYIRLKPLDDATAVLIAL